MAAAAPVSTDHDVAAPEVQLLGIGKRFPGVVANHDVDITIRPGTVHALVGENGAGKSTLMKILYGVQKPDDGTIMIDGEPRHLQARRPTRSRVGIGMVFQHFMLADNLTVLENVVLGAEKLHGIGDEARAEFAAISDALRLRPRPRRARRAARRRRPPAGGDPQGPLPRRQGDHPRRADRGAGARRRSTRSSTNLRDLQARRGTPLLFISHKLDEVLADRRRHHRHAPRHHRRRGRARRRSPSASWPS